MQMFFYVKNLITIMTQWPEEDLNKTFMPFD